MSFASLTARLNLDIADFSAKLSNASKRMSEFAKKTNEGYGTATATLKSHNLGLKDTARIVQGILVSQTFYAIAGTIRDATSALWSFNEALDYAQVTYSALFGSSQMASDFLSVLQEHAVNTIFEFDTLAKSSKKLLAYGIEYKNLMYIMEGLTNLGAMSGDEAALDRIAYALGQIYAKGKLTAEEMRQLANAYVPIQDIIKERFNLTEEQLGNVSDLNLPAEEVINAIVDYANEAFGGVGDAAMMTITGLKNRIVDTVKVLGTEMLAPVTVAFKSFLSFVASGLERIREAYKSGGAGGILEALVPDPHMQQTWRQFIANARNLLMSLISILKVVANVAGQAGYTFITAFNLLTPVILPVINTLAYFLNELLKTSGGATVLRTALVVAAGAFLILKAQALGALVVTAVTKAIAGLSKALLVLSAIITKHPILSMLAMLAIGLVAVASSSKKANGALTDMTDKLSGVTGGLSTDDVLQTIEKDIEENSSAADQFNQKLVEGSSAAEDLENAINGVGDAAKKASGLFSFDEVFKLNETSDDSEAGGALGAIDDLIGSINGLSGNLGEALIPDIPDFSEYSDAFVDSLFGGIGEAISERTKVAGIGALVGTILGGIIGGILGGPAGAKIGAAIGSLAGGVVGLLWNEFDISLNNTATGAALGIAAAIAKAFGGSIKQLPSLLVGSGSITGFFKAFADLFRGAGLKSVLKGGLIGAAVGFVVDAIAAVFFDWFAEALELEGNATGNAKVGSTIGGIIGAIVGTIFFGPVGTLIAGAIGTFAGGFVGVFWDKIKEWFIKTDAKFDEWHLSTSERIRNWAYETTIDIGLWYIDTTTAISTWATDTRASVEGWVSSTSEEFDTWKYDTGEKVRNWANDTWASIDGWAGKTSEKINEWFSKNTSGFTEWNNNTREKIKNWALNTAIDLAAWYVRTTTQLSDWVSETKTSFKNWWGGIWDTSEWKSGWSHVKEWFSNLFSDIKSWFSDIGSNISNWWDGLWDGKSANVSVNSSVGGGGQFKLGGHATGGIFNREHIARFAEGNKAEAVIPLEDRNAMAPFVTSISDGILQGLLPAMASGVGNNNQLPPMYVGTLVADERGLQQLFKKFEVYEAKELARKGLN